MSGRGMRVSGGRTGGRGGKARGRSNQREAKSRRSDARGAGDPMWQDEREEDGSSVVDSSRALEFEPEFGDFCEPPALPADLVDSDADDLVVGRVVRLDRGYPLITWAGGTCRAEHATSLIKNDRLRSCVGDWVVLGLHGDHDKGVIERILPRSSELSRWDGHAHGDRQILAANLDLVVAVMPLSSHGMRLDHIVRCSVLAHEAGCDCAVVLTKADRAGDEGVAQACHDIRECLGDDVALVVTSSFEGVGLEDVRSLLRERTTSMLLGASGAGKSTLVNELVGTQVLGTGAVRERDDQGRHTTVSRRMVKVPGAGVIVDAPGLRSLPLLDEYRGLALAFPDIADLVPTCRFRDCTHGPEPGCAVRGAVEAGEIPETRLAQYRELEAEMRTNRLGLDPSARQSITN